jgi:hypothetical protein
VVVQEYKKEKWNSRKSKRSEISSLVPILYLSAQVVYGYKKYNKSEMLKYVDTTHHQII